MLDRLRICRVSVTILDGVHELTLHVPEISGILGHTVSLAFKLYAWRNHPHPFRLSSLNAHQKF